MRTALAGLAGVLQEGPEAEPGLLPEAWQRRHAHFLRNALDYMVGKVHDECVRSLDGVL